MGSPAYAIPEKLFFKIGEVCELTDIQAHVLRYWESEFPMLAPQKNPAGQRTYRKRDVEIVMRIKELLYRLWTVIRIAQQVLKFRTFTNVGIVKRQVNRKRLAGLVGGDCTELPSRDDLVHHSMSP